MSQHPPISSLVSAALERNRERLNARFALSRRGGAGLDGAAVLDHLRDSVAPVIDAASAVAPESADSVLNALFDVSLELFAAGMLGPGSKAALITEMWQKVLPAAGRLLPRGGQIVAASLSNAAYHIERTDGTRWDLWIDCMGRVAAISESPAELLEAGKVVAWRCGLVQYRRAAMDSARGLRPAMVAAVFGISETQVAAALDRMHENPWLSPAAAVDGLAAKLRLVRHVGAFRGFGGEFLAPPRVWQEQGNLFAGDGQGHWQIICDCFGSVLLRHDAPPPPNLPPPVDAKFDGQTLRVGTEYVQLPQLRDVSSIAQSQHTVAITVESSHHVFLIARAPEAADVR